MIRELPLTFGSLWRVQAEQPLHWIIDTAPVVLGCVASLAGRYLDRVVSLNRQLEQRVEAQGHDLEQTRGDLERVVAAARCILWVADVTRGRDGFEWRLHIRNEPAARRLLPLAVGREQSYADAFRLSQVPEDRAGVLQRRSQALMEGQDSFRHTYRCTSLDDNVHWLQEDARIESTGAGQWHVTGICTDVTGLQAAPEPPAEPEAA